MFFLELFFCFILLFLFLYRSVNCAVFAGDDKIISGSDDKSVKIWDLKNMRTPLHAIRVDSAVNRMSVAPSNHIAIPMDNRNVLLYDITGHRLGRIPRNNRQVIHLINYDYCFKTHGNLKKS